MQRRLLAGLLLITVSTTACATGAEMRQQVRADYVVPEETTDLVLQQDIERCKKEADDKSRSLAITSMVLSGVGIIIWPLIIPALGTAAASLAKSESAKSECLTAAGYLKK